MSVQAFDESTVTSEVDRILNLVNVNDFLTPTKPTTAVVDQTRTPLQSDQSTVPIANESEASSTQEPALAPTPTIPPATKILAAFTHSAQTSVLTLELRSQLNECLVDYIAVTACGATLSQSSPSILKGISSLTALTTLSGVESRSACTVITGGRNQPLHYAALLNAAYGHSLDFDDTHAEASLHAGVSTIPTALAQAEAMLRADPLSLSTDDILLAMLIGYEITIRIGIALSTASYARGFHNTSTAGVFGSVATIAVLRKLEPGIIENAFGLAGSKAAGSMQYLANGSHNKRLHPGFAAHDAFMCIALAEAGVVGADNIIEGDLGLLQAYTDRDRSQVDWSRLVGNLGTVWEFGDNALKPYAGCRMTHVFIELADSIGKGMRDGRFAGIGAKSIQKIRCYMPKANMILIGQPGQNKIHPENVVDAQFSCYFQVANALLFGGSHDMTAYDRLHDKDLHLMCDKIQCHVDDSIARMGGRMDVFLEDDNGEVVDILRRSLPEPLGEKSHPFVTEQVYAKFLGLTSKVYGPAKSEKVLDMVKSLKDPSAKNNILELLDLLATRKS